MATVTVTITKEDLKNLKQEIVDHPYKVSFDVSNLYRQMKEKYIVAAANEFAQSRSTEKVDTVMFAEKYVQVADLDEFRKISPCFSNWHDLVRKKLNNDTMYKYGGYEVVYEK